jgi:ech hydrogenase subunit D
MFEPQETVLLEREELPDRVRRMLEEGSRLVQIGCTKIGRFFQVDYTFDKAYRFLNLRVMIPDEDAMLPSVTGAYACAFTYENEIHDLFGIRFEGIKVDYQGNFFRVGVKAPFSQPETRPEES